MKKSKLPNWAKFLKAHDPLRPNMGIAHLRNGFMYMTDGHILYKVAVKKFITAGEEFADGKALGVQVLEAMQKATSITLKENTIELFDVKGELSSVYYYVAKQNDKGQYVWYIETNGQPKEKDGTTPYLNIEVAVPNVQTHPYRFFPINTKLLALLSSLFIGDSDKFVLRTNKKGKEEFGNINQTAVFVYPATWDVTESLINCGELGIIMPLVLSDAKEAELNDLVNKELGINQPTPDLLDV